MTTINFDRALSGQLLAAFHILKAGFGVVTGPALPGQLYKN
jgi:hypothetical protein